MENIFKNAYFGKPYKTRGGRKAIYLVDDICWVEGEDSETIYSRDGRFCFPEIYDIDIVSEWQEEISEEELDKLAELFTPLELITHYNLSISREQVGILREVFKAGYCKAMEKYGSN